MINTMPCNCFNYRHDDGMVNMRLFQIYPNERESRMGFFDSPYIAPKFIEMFTGSKL